MLFGGLKTSLGIDIGAGGVKAVELKKEKGRPILFTFGLTSATQDIHSFWQRSVRQQEGILKEEANEENFTPPVMPGPEIIKKYAGLLKQVCKEAKIISKSAVVSLPVSAVFHAVVTLPLVEKKLFEPILKAEVKKLITYPLSEAVLDYQIIPVSEQSKNAQQVLVNAVPRALVAFYTTIFNKAGIKLLALETEAAALTRSLVGRDEAIIMIIDMGAERTNFFIIDHGAPVTHQSVELGGNRINSLLASQLKLNPAEVERIKQDLFGYLINNPQESAIFSREKLAGLLVNVLEPIIKEVEYAFNLYLRQSINEKRKPEKIILTGGGAFCPYLPQILSDKFNLKCYIGDPWGRVLCQDGLKAVLNKIGPRLSVAIGLALKDMV